MPLVGTLYLKRYILAVTGMISVCSAPWVTQQQLVRIQLNNIANIGCLGVQHASLRDEEMSYWTRRNIFYKYFNFINFFKQMVHTFVYIALAGKHQLCKLSLFAFQCTWMYGV